MKSRPSMRRGTRTIARRRPGLEALDERLLLSHLPGLALTDPPPPAVVAASPRPAGHPAQDQVTSPPSTSSSANTTIDHFTPDTVSYQQPPTSSSADTSGGQAGQGPVVPDHPGPMFQAIAYVVFVPAHAASTAWSSA